MEVDASLLVFSLGWWWKVGGADEWMGWYRLPFPSYLFFSRFWGVCDDECGWGRAFSGVFFLIFFFFVFQSSDVSWSEYEKRMKRNRKGKITTEIDTPTFLDQRAEERQTICFFSFDFRALAESFTM